MLPVAETALFDAVCRRLWPVRRTEVRSTPRRGVRRVLTEYAAVPAPAPRPDTLTIGTGAHEEFTEEYRALTRDFYLKF